MRRHFLSIGTATVALGLALTLGLAATASHAEGLFDRRVDVDRLSAVRGGFMAPDGGLVISFGLQRTVLVDGAVVAQANDASTLLVLQRGANNSVSITAGAGTAGTVIQNSLDNQKLQAVTVLDVTTNSLQAFRGVALQSQLRTSLTDSVRR